MNDPGPQFDVTRIDGDLPPESAVSELIRQLNQKTADPIDALIDDLLGGGDAAGWLSGWRGREAWPAGLWQRMIEEALPIEEIEAAKHRAKRAFRPTGPNHRRHAAMLAYLLSLAAGLVHHGRLLSSMPPETVQDWLTAVGGAVGEPLTGVFIEAAEALGRG